WRNPEATKPACAGSVAVGLGAGTRGPIDGCNGHLGLPVGVLAANSNFSDFCRYLLISFNGRNGRRHTGAVGWISHGAVVDMALLHISRNTGNGACRVLEQLPLLLRRHQAEQIAWLTEIVFVDPVVPVICRTFQRKGWFAEVRLL